jgi:hypothetical protein
VQQLVDPQGWPTGVHPPASATHVPAGHASPEQQDIVVQDCPRSAQHVLPPHV